MLFCFDKTDNFFFTFIFQLDLKLNSEKGGDISTYVTNGEWDLIGKSSSSSLNVCFNVECSEADSRLSVKSKEIFKTFKHEKAKRKINGKII